MKIKQIRIDGGTQPREAINTDVVVEYTEAIHDGATFPPVTVFHDGQDYWLADGFHRIAAPRAAGKTDIDSDVVQGTRRDAQWYSFGANKAHGLRRNKGDAKRAIEKILNDSEWSRVPQSEIAGHVGVSAAYVSQVKSSINNLIDKPAERTVTRGNTIYTQNTAKIGVSPKPKTDDVDMWEPETPTGPRPLVDLEGISPDLYAQATHIGGSIQDFADIAKMDPERMAKGFKQFEKPRVIAHAEKTIEWLQRFVESLREEL
ncbi:MAG: hypothetical protein LAT68_14305 [Cyclobacteriaceae bacterium]|nr:hypothetical protein [Cyclobacteriaceae bacterium]